MNTSNNLHQKFFAWENRFQAFTMAKKLLEQGEKVRIAVWTNNGWHSYDSCLIVRWGERIRNPMSLYEIVDSCSDKAYEQDCRKAAQLWYAVRG